ncbi:MAG: hypothetical protein JWO82_3281, partial [Akkermansiaceae bacterium]|nr:hypothetical protein [Akkermansiaceae bacterium]
MFGGKDKGKKGSGDSGWGGGGSSSGGGDEFWGAAPPPSDLPPSAVAPIRTSAADTPLPPGRRISLLEGLDPLFLFICQQHRIAREGKALSFQHVRDETVRLVEVIEDRCRRDPVLQQQFERVRDPLLWYVDYWFGSSGEFSTLRDPWNQNRMGEYPDDDEEGSLAGDEAFYDKLEETLKSDAQDE